MYVHCTLLSNYPYNGATGFAWDSGIFYWCLWFCTDKKENKIFLIYKENLSGSGAKSYMRKGFLMYEEMRKFFPIYEEAVSHIWLCTRSLLISLYRGKSYFPFYQCGWDNKARFLFYSLVSRGSTPPPPLSIYYSLCLKLRALKIRQNSDPFYDIQRRVVARKRLESNRIKRLERQQKATIFKLFLHQQTSCTDKKWI